MSRDQPPWDRIVLDASSDRRRFPTVVSAALAIGALLFMPAVFDVREYAFASILLSLLQLVAFSIEHQWFPQSQVHVRERSVRAIFRRSRWPWKVREMTIPYETITAARMNGSYLELDVQDPATFARKVLRAWVPRADRDAIAALAPKFLRRPTGLTRADRPEYTASASSAPNTSRLPTL